MVGRTSTWYPTGPGKSRDTHPSPHPRGGPRGQAPGPGGGPGGQPFPATDGVWWKLREVLVGSEDLVQVRKVVSHCLVQNACDPVEQWAYWHNNLTDKAAEAINVRRPQVFWDVWRGLHSALQFHRQLHWAIQRVLLQTSKLAVASQKSAEEVQQQGLPIVDLPAVPVAWVIPTKLVQHYGDSNIRKLHAWWTEVGLRMLQGTQPLIYIAGVQLFFTFNLHSGHQGPWCLRKRWYSIESEVPAAAQTNWGARTGLFMRMLRSYQKGNNLVIPSKMARPHSTAIGRWMVCLKMRWCQRQLDSVD